MDNLLFESKYIGSWVKVYTNKLEFGILGSRNVIPINQIASTQRDAFMFMQIIIETTGGKKYTIPCWKSKEIQEAILKAQEGNV